MEESSSSDHLNSSLTDLMTSLMVIFILLLLVFVQRTGAKDTAEATMLLTELETQLKGAPDSPTIRQEQNRILLIAPERLMSFESGRYALSNEGKAFLQEKLPAIAGILYAKRFRDGIESIVVEGHSDLQAFQGLPADESRNANLELSQQRAMEVVKTALEDLKTTAQEEQDWFVAKLSSSGRGQQDCQAVDVQDECRKVIFVIRVRATDAETIKAKMK